ncbi:MAG: DUF3997 domain-containing protein [Saprospirales bacterium]|nr:DUF3997 domain-containing protein [Saprospirales bacterium]
MKKIFGILVCLFFDSCYFGANESAGEIIKGFYLAHWDENTWIAHSLDGDSIYELKNIIISHNVFAVGNNDDFIVGKQHPCENKETHFMDFDSVKPNRKITNFFIIDTRNETYKIHQFDKEVHFDNEKKRLGIPDSLPYKFYSKELE